MTGSPFESPQDGVLPPVCGPAGEPRPPAAPAVGRARRYGVVVSHLDPVPTGHPVDVVARPPAEGPPLERAGVRTGLRWLSALAVAVGVELAAGVVASLAGWLDDPGPSLVVVLVVLFLVLFAWVFFADTTPPPISAGAWWVRGGKPAATVAVYRLTEVECSPVDGEPRLRLSDADATVSLDLGLLQANPALWALVHRGVRYSVVAGAHASDAARERLQLPSGCGP